LNTTLPSTYLDPERLFKAPQIQNPGQYTGPKHNRPSSHAWRGTHTPLRKMNGTNEMQLGRVGWGHLGRCADSTRVCIRRDKCSDNFQACCGIRVDNEPFSCTRQCLK